MADILTQLQTCLDQLATQFYATLGYLTTYHDNSPATPPPHIPTAGPALAKIPKNSTVPPVPASLAASQTQVSPTPQQQPSQQQHHHHHHHSTGNAGGDGAAGTGEDNLQPTPDSPTTFARRQRELARDLIIKEQQIEYLISVLPGIGASEAEQESRIRVLESELRNVEMVRTEKVRELSVLRDRLETVLGAVKVGVYADDRVYQK